MSTTSRTYKVLVPRGIEGLDRTGLTIVAAASVLLSVNMSAETLVTQPFADWLVIFLTGLVANSIMGIAILLGAVWARHRYPKPSSAQYASVFVAVFVAAFFADVALTEWFHGGTLGSNDRDWGFFGSIASIAFELVQFASVGMLIAGAWLYTRTDADHAAAIAQCAIDSARMDQQTAEARLSMLEAQIEPHFLFNTLAHVKRLYETDPGAGERMLCNLKTYLAVALPQMRATDATLGSELDHTVAYLDIQQIRMGRRLAYAIDVDDALRGARLPPLMLLTLVENAIKHGLNPVASGGRIDVRARVENDRLQLQVADTGRGFTRSGGAGTGLANIRARLAARFGQKANLALAMNTPSGVVATIALPYLPISQEARAP